MQVPFSTFEEVLKRRENRGLAGDLAKAIKAVQPGDGAGLALARCRDLVMQTPVPEELQNALRQAMRDGGIPVPEGEQWNDAMWALKVRGAPALLLLPARLLLRQAAHSPAAASPMRPAPAAGNQPTFPVPPSLPPSLPLPSPSRSLCGPASTTTAPTCPPARSASTLMTCAWRCCASASCPRR